MKGDGMRIGFIGAGRVGATLARALSAAGESAVAVASRRAESAESLALMLPACRATSAQGVADGADFVFITTPDDAIAGVAATVEWRAGQRVVHCSGATPLDALDPARAAGALVGGFHPLQTFAAPEEILAALPGTRFGIEAEEPLASELTSLADVLGGVPLRLRAGDRVLYHASAVIVSNYLVALAGEAAAIWRELGFESDEALQALLPLARGTVRNLERFGLPDSLTGPISRGDLGTVRRHLAVLGERAPDVTTLYRVLGEATLDVAIAKGSISDQTASELDDLLRRPALSRAAEENSGPDLVQSAPSSPTSLDR